MKKVTMFLLLMFLLITMSFAQEAESQTISGEVSGELILPTGVATSVDNIDVTFTTVYNDVKEALSGLANGLQVGGEHVYEVLVRQQLIVGITWLSYLILLVPICFIFVYSYKNIENGTSDATEGFNVFILVLSGCFALLTAILFIIELRVGLTGFFNPEYGAIQEILKLIN